MTDSGDRKLLLTAAWFFARHGQTARAAALCGALLEEDPRDAVPALALAGFRLEEGDAAGALEALRSAPAPEGAEREAALLEARALSALGKGDEAARRWRRHLDAAKGGARRWT